MASSSIYKALRGVIDEFFKTFKARLYHTKKLSLYKNGILAEQKTVFTGVVY